MNPFLVISIFPDLSNVGYASDRLIWVVAIEKSIVLMPPEKVWFLVHLKKDRDKAAAGFKPRTPWSIHLLPRVGESALTIKPRRPKWCYLFKNYVWVLKRSKKFQFVARTTKMLWFVRIHVQNSELNPEYKHNSKLNWTILPRLQYLSYYSKVILIPKLFNWG